MAGIMDRITGLLGTPGAQDFATGLLAQSGYTQTPTSFGQAIGGATQFAQNNQMQRMQLQAARQRLEDDKKKREATSQIQSLMGVPPSIRSPQAPEMLQGLLMQAAPEQMVGGLLGQQFQKPEDPRLSTAMNDYMAMTGQRPGAPGFMEGFQRFQQLQDPMAAQQSTLLGLQIENEQSEQTDRAETQRVERTTLQRNTNNDLKSLLKLHEMNEILAPTFLATGGVLPETRRDLQSLLAEGGRLFGIDTSEKEKIIDAWDTFKKEQENLANRVAERYGSNTNARYQGVINSIPNLGLNPEANRSVISRMIDDFLGGADDYGFNIEGRDKYESLLSDHAPASPSLPVAPSGRNVIRFDAQGNPI